MSSTNDSGEGHGTQGSPQMSVSQSQYPSKVDEIEGANNEKAEPVYDPSPKHKEGSGWGSANPITTQEEGQKLLETGYRDGKQVYNVTKEGKIVKFQPDNTPKNGYHSYEVSKPRDIPSRVLKKMLSDGKISKAQYNRLRKGKK